jgi:hypothetical protein
VPVVDVGKVRELCRRGEPQEEDKVRRQQVSRGFSCAAEAAAKRALHRR